MNAVRNSLNFRTSAVSLALHGLIIFALFWTGNIQPLKKPVPETAPELITTVNLIQDHFGNITKAAANVTASALSRQVSLSEEAKEPVSSRIPKDAVQNEDAGSARAGESQGITFVSNNLLNAVSYETLIKNAKRHSIISENALRKMLEEALLSSKWSRFENSKAAIIISYTENGDFYSASIQSEDESLKRILSEQIDYSDIPCPKDYFLPYRELRLKIQIIAGTVFVLR